MTYSITLERGANGTYLAWVDDLPGCAVRAPSRAEVLEKLPEAINEFVAWTGQAAPGTVEIDVVEEVESAIETDEDTEVLISADRAALTEQDWSQLLESLAKSRSELVALLAGLADDELESKREESERTVREEIEHVAFVELMYAMWTFDLRSREGLAEFLSWTRKVSEERMQQLAAQGATDLTWAEWAGAPRPEPWTARKAARRLLWHELLHLRALEGLRPRP
jgi:predicted RNase H-like HicB family nuclease